LAIEILTASAGLDQRRPLEPSRGVRAAYSFVRGAVPEMKGDRPLYRDIEMVLDLVRTQKLQKAVEKEIGNLV
jgi:histidine ammonia-lyase